MQQTRKYAHSQEDKKLIETVPVEAQAMGLIDKDFKSNVLSKLQELKEIIGKGNQENNVSQNREYQ